MANVDAAMPSATSASASGTIATLPPPPPKWRAADEAILSDVVKRIADVGIDNEAEQRKKAAKKARQRAQRDAEKTAEEEILTRNRLARDTALPDWQSDEEAEGKVTTGEGEAGSVDANGLDPDAEAVKATLELGVTVEISERHPMASGSGGSGGPRDHVQPKRKDWTEDDMEIVLAAEEHNTYRHSCRTCDIPKPASKLLLTELADWCGALELVCYECATTAETFLGTERAFAKHVKIGRAHV